MVKITDSIGRSPIGRSPMVGRKRVRFLRRTIEKMEQWRDKARISIVRQRNRYKKRVNDNRKLMDLKKAGRLPNLNFSGKVYEPEFKPKSIHRFEVTHSTVPAKPKYSIVKPAERIYGNRWPKFEKETKAKQKILLGIK